MSTDTITEILRPTAPEGYTTITWYEDDGMGITGETDYILINHIQTYIRHADKIGNYVTDGDNVYKIIYPDDDDATYSYSTKSGPCFISNQPILLTEG